MLSLINVKSLKNRTISIILFLYILIYNNQLMAFELTYNVHYTFHYLEIKLKLNTINSKIGTDYFQQY